MRANIDRAKSIFLHAIERYAPEGWPAYLDAACDGDAGLRARIEQLLAAHADMGTYDGPSAPLEATIDATAAEGVGTQIGPYKLLEQIGEGGFGVVYLAEQLRPVCRKVALKVLKAGMDTRQVIARFEAERQALALMDHPNIARILDAGTTGELRDSESAARNECECTSAAIARLEPCMSHSAGRPYFVMELFPGVPITEYCDRQRLATRERLALFVDVCHAVQHAHQKGIIHRDLKPTNVLVMRHDGKPLAKIIDFGIAKALGQKLTDKTLFTGAAQLIGTPLYMSPEQAALRDADVDTRSDVYSLGVMLYELLTGTTPFDKERIADVSYDELRRMIREDEPPRPSKRVSTFETALLSTVADRRCSDPRKLGPQFTGELDWIVMRALEKDRTRRYDTASSFAEDIERYLQDEPVVACPPSWVYRVRKFTRRNRVALATAGLFLALMLAATIVSVWYAVDARKARAAADKQRTNAQRSFGLANSAILDLVARLALEPRLKLADFHDVRKDLLSRVVRHYEELSALRADDTGIQKELAEAYGWQASLQHEMGQHEAARAGFERKLAIQVRLFDSNPTPDLRRGIAQSHTELGAVLRALEDAAGAEREFRAALELRKDLGAEFPDEAEDQTKLATSHGNLGVHLAEHGRTDEAEKELRAAIAGAHSLPEPSSVDPGYLEVMATVHGNLGLLLSGQGKHDEARAELRAGVKLWQELAAHTDVLTGSPKIRAGEARCRLGLAQALNKSRDMAAARVEFEAASQLFGELTDSFPRVQEYKELYAKSTFQLGVLLGETGDLPRAEEQFRKSLACAIALDAEFPGNRNYLEAMADSHQNLGKALRGQGKSAESDAAYREAVVLRRRLVADFPGVSAYALGLGQLCYNLGNWTRESGRSTEALEWYGQSVGVLEPMLRGQADQSTVSQVLAWAYWNRATVLATLKRHSEAVQDWERAGRLDEAKKPYFRLYRAYSLVFFDPAEALREADQVLADNASIAAVIAAIDGPEPLYEGACIYALLSGKETEVGVRNRLGKRAVELLEKARESGYFAAEAEIANMKHDTDLDSIRQREDFQQLLKELEPGAAP